MNSLSQQPHHCLISLTVFFLLVSLLSGCSLDDDTTNTPGPDPQTQDGTTAPGDNQQSNDTPSTSGDTENQPPNAKITPPGSFTSGQTVTLDGSKSSDPDGDSLSYKWAQTKGPNIAISNSSSSSLIFVAPMVTQATEYSFQLSVNDGYLSNSATVSVLVSPVADNTSPSIISRSPQPDQSGVSTTAEISVGFDKALRETSVNGQSLELSQSGVLVSGEVTYDSATKTIKNKPASALSPDATYTVTLADTLEDLSGNAVAGESWSFSTAAEMVADGKCATAEEGNSLMLSCPTGQVITAVTFASYGNPGGSCGSFTLGTCNASSSETLVSDACKGKSSCTLYAGSDPFGNPCEGTAKKLAAQVACGMATDSNEGQSPGTDADRVKPRIIATTDGEIDDRSSMVRFLVYSSDFDVEGIIQVNSKYQKSGHSRDKWIEKEIDLYEESYANLKVHNPDYPTADYLRSVMKVGNETSGDLNTDPPDMKTKDTEGEKWIISKLLDDDPRPIHVVSWGGANTTASALWRLKYSGDYTKEQFEKAVSKIRIYCIWYQDGGGKWIENNVKEAYIYEAYQWDNVWDYGSLKGPNPEEVRKYMTEDWLNANVKKGHGSLGAYTPQKYVSEGDTPSFLHLINNGLESHTDYTLGGWGGRAFFDEPDDKPNHLTDKPLDDDGDKNKMFWRWVIDAENDFAARMDWCVASSYSDANHQPVAKVAGGTIRTVSAGDTISLDATATTDPDGDSMTYKWWQYHDADSAETKITISNDTSKDAASFVVPNEPGKQVHIIFEAKDDGDPPLKGYQRIIFNIQ